MRRAFGLGFVFATTACASVVGLSEYVISEDDAGVASADGGDASTPAADTGAGVTDAGPDAALPVCACATKTPLGWTEVAYADDRSTACPGDLRGADRVTSPSLDGGAEAGAPCSCAACTVTATPSCNTGKWTTNIDQSGAARCDKPSGIQQDVNNGNCVPGNGTLAMHSRVVPPSPSGNASCTAAAVFDPSAASSRGVRVCSAIPGGSTCPCEVAAKPFAACIMGAGDVPCPTGFSIRHVVGAGVTGTCAPCSCAASATCGGSVTWYQDFACAVPRVTTNDTDCTSTGSPTWSSFKPSFTPTVKCAASPGVPTAIGVAEPATVCCP